MSRTMTTALLCLLVLSFCLAARAEVSVRTDRNGSYVKTQILPVGPYAEERAWGFRGRGFRQEFVLNPNGDINGDLWPTIGESPKAPHYPFVVWSRFNGANYDMAWSRWNTDGWADVEYISSKPMPGDDLDADVAFDANGRPYVVWWSDMEEGGGRIFFSLFLANRWFSPILISDPAIDSRFPTLEVSTARELSISYETPEGSVTQYVSFGSPNTITDDINPQACIFISIPAALMNQAD